MMRSLAVSPEEISTESPRSRATLTGLKMTRLFGPSVATCRPLWSKIKALAGTLRLAAADIVSAAAALEIRSAGGKGYARRTDASRRFREAAFIPVQSPSEAQLRWELRTGR